MGIGIPNFREEIKAFNEQHLSTVGPKGLITDIKFDIDMRKSNDVQAQITLLSANEWQNVMPEMIAKLQKGVHEYFAKYPETLNNVKPGIYQANITFFGV